MDSKITRIIFEHEYQHLLINTYLKIIISFQIFTRRQLRSIQLVRLWARVPSTPMKDITLYVVRAHSSTVDDNIPKCDATELCDFVRCKNSEINTFKNSIPIENCLDIESFKVIHTHFYNFHTRICLHLVFL